MGETTITTVVSADDEEIHDLKLKLHKLEREAEKARLRRRCRELERQIRVDKGGVW